MTVLSRHRLRVLDAELRVIQAALAEHVGHDIAVAYEEGVPTLIKCSTCGVKLWGKRGGRT